MNETFLSKYDMLPEGAHVLCALSGGADSMYLLCRLCERGHHVTAAHFNHRLRGTESERDEAFVRGFCESHSIPLLIDSADTITFARKHGLGIEDAARQLRYTFLYKAAAQVHADRIATAHTADDELETMLLNLLRGSGLRGLGAIAPRRGILVRPILTITHQEIRQWLDCHGINHVEDSSNNNVLYARNRLRKQVLPVLRQINPACSEHAVQAALLMREDEQYLHTQAMDFLQKYQLNGLLPADKLVALPFALSSRVVRLAAGSQLSLTHVQAVLKLCASSRVHGRLDLPGTQAVLEYGSLRFGASSSLSIPEREVHPNTKTDLPEAGYRISCRYLAPDEEKLDQQNIFYFQSECICGTIFCKSRSEGDSIRLSGRPCTKSLKKLFSEARIMPSNRNRIPVLYDACGPIAVVGFGVAERVAAKGTGTTLCIAFEKLETAPANN